jgi:prepilin-type N-terminal cleavage/methylation domain-containing protein
MKDFNVELKPNSVSEKGFTLIEVLIALVVFSIGIMAVMSMIMAAMNGYSRARKSTVEVNRTSLNLESVKQAGYTELAEFSNIQGGILENTENAVVRGTQLVVMENDAIHGSRGAYQIFYIKPLIQ